MNNNMNKCNDKVFGINRRNALRIVVASTVVLGIVTTIISKDMTGFAASMILATPLFFLNEDDED